MMKIIDIKQFMKMLEIIFGDSLLKELKKNVSPISIYTLSNSKKEWTDISKWNDFEQDSYCYSDKEEHDLFLGNFKTGHAILISDESLFRKECLCFNLFEFEKFKNEYIERYKCEFFQPEDYIIYFIDYNSFRLIYNAGKIIEIDMKNELIKQKIIDIIG